MPPKKKRKRRTLTPESKSKPIIKRRNELFTHLIDKLKDPLSHLQYYREMQLLLSKYSMHYNSQGLLFRILLYANETDFFRWKVLLTIIPNQELNVRKWMVRCLRRGFIARIKVGKIYQYYITAEGKSYLESFRQDAIKIVLGIINNDRVVKKKKSIFKKSASIDKEAGSF